MSKKAKQVDPIPDDFVSYEEAAKFWDTHDITDYTALKLSLHTGLT
jgi:hypothetical protein